MPAVVPFIPLIAQGVGLAAGAIGGKKATKSAMQRSPEEQTALAGAQGIAGKAAETGQSLLGEGRGNLQLPANYYRTLLTGNRAAMANAVAAPTAAITETFRGAERGLERGGVRGAQRSLAQGELARQRASQIAGLTTGVQPYAADALAKMGTTGLQAGTNLTTAAGNIYGNLLGQGFQNRTYARKEGGDFGRAVGGLTATAGNILGGMFGNKAGGGAFPEPALGNLEQWKQTQGSYGW